MAAAGTAGSPEQWPAHIRERYGVRRRPRWVTPVLAALAALVVVVATWVAWTLSRPAIDAGIRSYRTVADDRIDIRFAVDRRDRSSATCVLRSRAEDGFDVGYATVQLPPASGRTVHDYRMRTAYRALVAEVVGCGIDGPPPGIPGTQFRPGVTPPEQPWTP